MGIDFLAERTGEDHTCEESAGACGRLNQQSRRGLTDGFAFVPKTVPCFTRHRQGLSNW
jgi:hypothetical protein